MRYNTTAIVFLITVLFSQSLVAEKLQRGEWYINLLLTSAADGLEDPYNKLGQRRGALPDYDSFDLPELGQTQPGTYLSVIFNRPDWDADKTTFNSDFHPVAKKQSDEWTFEVRSNSNSRALSLTWKGKRTKMKRMVLVDLDLNETIVAAIDGVPQVYQFNMGGEYVRHFAWRKLTRKEFKALSTPEEAAPALSGVAAFRLSATETSAAGARSSEDDSWLPLGWSQDQETGSTPIGLPADPFAD
jgi:hypothetical protein